MDTNLDQSSSSNADGPVRYAVVGLGHIAQAAVLPAFSHAGNSTLAALVSGDAEKRRKLSKKYKAPAFDYADYPACLVREGIEAVYIALPNDKHKEFTTSAAALGINVLCEKPMAVSAADCRAMRDAARENSVKLMIAYRLHFEEANLKALDIVRSGQIGEPRYFSSSFSMQVKDGNIRLQQERGGGTLLDIGIYCINGARSLLGAEPTEVFARSIAGSDPRFTEVDEMTSATMLFPGDRLAQFTSSFGATDVSDYRIVGTEGELVVERGFEYAERITHYLTVGGKTNKQVFAKRDQFAAELTYFSRCIREHREPEPSGEEGLADVRIIEAMLESARLGQAVPVPAGAQPRHPSPDQEIHEPPSGAPRELVHTESPSW